MSSRLQVLFWISVHIILRIWHAAADLVLSLALHLFENIRQWSRRNWIIGSKMGDIRNSEDIVVVPETRVLRTKPRVLVTGFGPFGEHSINASWEAVQQLKNFADLTDCVDLVIQEIPVVYSDVAVVVPELWTRYAPDYVIHCGVSGLLAHRNAIQIERHAHNYGYVRPDVCSSVPSGGCFSLQQEKKCLSTGLCVEELVVNEVGQREDCSLSCQISEDAGRYLCEFIYYTSLSIDADRTLFIHVPPLHKPFCAVEIGKAIKRVILRMVARTEKTARPAAVEPEVEEIVRLAVCL